MENKLNIATFSDSFYPIIGGRENVIHNLMTSLNNKCNCFLATTTFKGHKETIKDSDLPYKVIRCKSLRITKNEYLSIINKSFRDEIENKIKNGEIDIIHVHTKYALLNYAFKLRKKYNIPVVTTVHTNYLEQYKKQLKIPFIYNFLLRRVKKVLNKVDCIYTVSQTMKDILIKWGIIKEITIIPNGNDLVYPENPEEIINNTKSLYNLKNSNILLYVGRMVETKNISFLFDVLKDLKEQNVNYKMIFVGGGEVNKYKKLSKQLNIENNCIFTGAISDREKLRALYLAADLFVCPSIIESFGLTIREAGSMGTPSVVIDGCATSEGIIDSHNGFLSKNNKNSFLLKIITALSDKSKLKTIGKNAKATYTTTWDEVANIQINKYNELLKNKRVSI